MPLPYPEEPSSPHIEEADLALLRVDVELLDATYPPPVPVVDVEPSDVLRPVFEAQIVGIA